MKTFLAIACIYFPIAGCSSMLLPNADQMKALAGDPNSVCFTATSVYASVALDRNHGCGQAPAPAAKIVLPAVQLNPNGTVRSFGFTGQ